MTLGELRRERVKGSFSDHLTEPNLGARKACRDGLSPGDKSHDGAGALKRVPLRVVS